MRDPGLVIRSAVLTDSPRRTDVGSSRSSCIALGRGASSTSTPTSTAHSSSHNHTVEAAGRSTTGTMPRRTSQRAREVRAMKDQGRSARDRHGAERAVEHGGHVDALELGLGTQ